MIPLYTSCFLYYLDNRDRDLRLRNCLWHALRRQEGIIAPKKPCYNPLISLEYPLFFALSKIIVVTEFWLAETCFACAPQAGEGLFAPKGRYNPP